MTLLAMTSTKHRSACRASKWMWAFLAGMASWPLLANPASAQTTSGTTTSEAREQARIHFARGLELHQDGDYEPALVEFRRAYEKAPDYRVLYNIGQVSFQLGDFVGALHALEQYLRDGGHDVPADRRASVTRDIEKLRLRIASVRLVVKPDGATVAVDGTTVGKAPFGEPLLVNTGRRRIAASHPGYQPAFRVLELAGGEETVVTLELEQVKPAVAPAPQVAPARGRTPDTQPAEPPTTWPLWAAAGTLAVGAGVFGLLAVQHNSDLEDKRVTPGITRAELNSAQSKAKTMALTSDILSGAAVVTAGIAIWVGASGSPERGTTAPVALHMSPARIWLEGVF